MDRGESWRSFKDLGWGQGLPDATQMKRISLATRRGVLWALLMSPSDTFELFQSDDHGRSWSLLSLPNKFSSKGFFDVCGCPPELEHPTCGCRAPFP